LGHITMPLGLFTHLTFEPAMQAFEPGARLLLVTKGILEATHGREQFGLERVTALVETLPPGSAFDLCGAMLKQAQEFRKLPWYSPEKLPFVKPDAHADLPTVVLVRPNGNPPADSTSGHVSSPKPMFALQQQLGPIDIYLFDQILRNNIHPGMRVLDAGCGPGRNLIYLLREGYEIFASDQNPNAVAETR